MSQPVSRVTTEILRLRPEKGRIGFLGFILNYRIS